MDVAISIITPLYNIKNYLKECVTSVLNQTFEGFEIILVDDGSNDGSGEICDEFALSDERVKVIHKNNGGPQSACIMGLKESKGKYICFIDGDDLIEPSYLYDMYKSAITNAADIVISPSYNYINTEKVLRKCEIAPGIYQEKDIIDSIYPVLINSGGFLSRGIQSTRWGKLFLRSVLENNIEYFDESLFYGEDLNMIFPAFLDSKVIVINDINTAGYCYRCNPNSIVNNYKKNLYEQTVNLHKGMLKCSDDKKIYDFKKQIYADYVAGIVYCYTNEIKSKENWKYVVRRLDVIAKDDLFKKSLRVTRISNYPIMNKIIIMLLIRWGFLERSIISKIIYFISHIR